MEHEFSHRLLQAAVRLRELMQMPPVQLDDREAFLLAQLLDRAAVEVREVESLRKTIHSLKRRLSGKEE